MKFNALVLMVAVSAAACAGANAQQPTISVDGDDLGGVVTSAKGPEAGVWVIAETTDLPTKLAKIVVTDDGGRYLLPDLPKANYTVWVRGYGLVDSAKVRAVPGKVMNLTASVAPTPRAAAEYYPAGYWFSLLQVPAESEFPGRGPTSTGGNGIAPTVRSQAEWLRSVKSGGCWACHQLGNKATREIPAALGRFPSSAAAWDRRIQSGQAGAQMSGGLNQIGPRACAGDVRRLDRPHRRRRAASHAPASAGRRTQRRHHAVGLGRSESVPPRRRVHGSA